MNEGKYVHMWDKKTKKKKLFIFGHFNYCGDHQSDEMGQPEPNLLEGCLVFFFL